jgi:hypothetical protein
MTAVSAFAPKAVKYAASRENIAQRRTVCKPDLARAQRTPCKQGKRAVFCTLHSYLTVQTFFSSYNKLLHKRHSLKNKV